MNFLKIVNVPLSILRADKYSSTDDAINWAACGFNATQLKSQAIQYKKDDNNFIQYLPIFDQDKFDSILPDFKSDAELLGDHSIEVIEEADVDYDSWKASALASKKE